MPNGHAVSDAIVRPTPFERLVDRIPFLDKELLLLRRLVHAGDACVDVGAAGGAHLLMMAFLAGPHGRVLAFEARPRSAGMLRRLTRWAGVADRVDVFAVALSDRDGVASLRIPIVPTRAHLPGVTLGAEAHAAFAGLPHQAIDVPTTSLDRVVGEAGVARVGLLKIDVEGAELDVLAGATHVLAAHRPVVVIEAEDRHQRRSGATAQAVLDTVTARGYRPFRFRRGRLAPVATATSDEGNYVLVPVERVPDRLLEPARAA